MQVKKNNSLSVLDSFVGHLTQPVKDKCQETNTVLYVIPVSLHLLYNR